MINVNFEVIILLLFILIIVISHVRASARIKELEDICNTLQKVNNNLCKTFPDINVLLNVKQKKQVQDKEPAEPTGLQLYKAVRTKGAPDIRLGEISEVIIAATNRRSATELMKKVDHFEDDDWWILEDIKEEQIISVKHLGGLGDD